MIVFIVMFGNLFLFFKQNNLIADKKKRARNGIENST